MELTNDEFTILFGLQMNCNHVIHPAFINEFLLKKKGSEGEYVGDMFEI